MKRKTSWLALLIAVLLLLAACSPGETTQPDPAPPQTESNTPEAAVITYLEGLRDSDLNSMIQALPRDLPDGIYAEEIIEEFIAHLNWLLEHFGSPLNPSEFQSLTILGFIPPEALDERYASEVNQGNLATQGERLGVAQLLSHAVLFELGGETYMLIVDVADFGSAWHITQFGGNLGALLFIAPQMQGLIPPEFVDEFLGEIDLESALISP
ncbi:MAG: hypothetical protein FWC72_00750 [Oscillospiraceae bacterium]|nr:hypothetical protein [Oscillospiraceae bacterium]